MAKDKHVIEALGKARVTIENGKITDVGEPEIKVCLKSKYVLFFKRSEESMN